MGETIDLQWRILHKQAQNVTDNKIIKFFLFSSVSLQSQYGEWDFKDAGSVN